MRALIAMMLVALVAPMSVTPPVPAAADPFGALVRADLDFAAARLASTADSLPATSYPSATTPDGRWTTTGADRWTSGFLPGAMWLLYERTGAPTWRAWATARQAGIEGQKVDTSTHDVGFEVFTSFGNAARLTGSTADRQVVMDAAASLATRYSPVAGAIRSWDGPTPSHFRVIVDNLMNLEILYWGCTHGGPRTWCDIATRHARTTIDRLVRPDGSTYQGVDLDPRTGAVKDHFTHQGFAVESTWSRGQAWAIHGFTMVYRETGDARFLDAARRVADWYLDHLPADNVPYWDFGAPGIPDAPRDSSAAAIAASGLLELATLETDAARAANDREAAWAALTSLSSPAYLASGTDDPAILLHGTLNEPAGSADTGLIFGDYYFIEALLRADATSARRSLSPAE